MQASTQEGEERKRKILTYPDSFHQAYSFYIWRSGLNIYRWKGFYYKDQIYYRASGGVYNSI